MSETQITIELQDPLVVARFWSKVDVGRPGACWKWRAATNEHGYGLIRVSPEVGLVKAHRMAWALLNGLSIPGPNLVVRHSCDNPPCCNPAHLSLGTQGENVEDMHVRGRRKYDTSVGPEIEQHMRAMSAQGARQSDIAASLGCSQSYVSMILSGARGASYRKASV